MENIFVSKLIIEKVFHLKDVTIGLSETEKKHLILTGKNGSGKTSVLDAAADFLTSIIEEKMEEELNKERISDTGKTAGNSEKAEAETEEAAKDEDSIEKSAAETLLIMKQEIKDGTFSEAESKNRILTYAEKLEKILGLKKINKNKVILDFRPSNADLGASFCKGEFILAYYEADRILQTKVPRHVEKITLRDRYDLTDTPVQEFAKYLVDMKVTEALAVNKGHIEKADSIHRWFEKLQDLLRRIFADETLELLFEEDSFSFVIQEKNKEKFDFNTLSRGYAAVLAIVLDLIMRMEKQTKKSFQFTMPGIVLIDEIEAHLHVELQKAILPLLTTVFPNIQFIVSTHSPFILNSISDAVIYDLENHTLVREGLADVPYGGIVEGYFRTSEMSNLLEEKFSRYKELVHKKELTDHDFEEIAELEMYLNEIPDYLALDITTEYQRLKLEFENREDIS